MSRGAAFEASSEEAALQHSVVPALKMNDGDDTAAQHEESEAAENGEKYIKKDEATPSASQASPAVSEIDDPPALTRENSALTSPQHLDSETESEEELDEPPQPAKGVLPQPLGTLPLSSTIEDPEEMPLKQDEPSQDGISGFLTASQASHKTYGKSRRTASTFARDSSTASTIPESAKSDNAHVSTSFVAFETAARTVTKRSTPHGGDTNVNIPAEDVEDGVINADVDVEEEHEVSRSTSDDTPMLNLKKRPLEEEGSFSDDGADTRLLKAARHEESSLEEIVAAKSSSSKLKTPSRPSTRISTQQGRGTQRLNKTPVTPAPKSSAMPLSGKLPNKFLLSSSKLSNPERGWLKKQGKVVEEVPGRKVNFICVVREKGLPATVKVLRSLIANKPVVSDQWVTDSKDSSELLDPVDYLHPDLQGSDIMQNDRRYIWKGKTLFFTTSAAKSYGDDWKGVQLIASEAGAAAVEHGNASKGGELLHDKVNTILFGTDTTKDRDAQELLSEYGRTVYDTKMFSTAIINADVDLESDKFQLALLIEGVGKGKKARGR